MFLVQNKRNHSQSSWPELNSAGRADHIFATRCNELKSRRYSTSLAKLAGYRVGTRTLNLLSRVESLEEGVYLLW